MTMTLTLTPHVYNRKGDRYYEGSGSARVRCWGNQHEETWSRSETLRGGVKIDYAASDGAYGITWGTDSTRCQHGVLGGGEGEVIRSESEGLIFTGFERTSEGGATETFYWRFTRSG